jgi:membrane protein
LLVLLVLIVGAVFGPDAARGELVGRLEGAVGAESASLLQEMIDNAGDRTSGDTLTAAFGFLMLILGATGLFTALEDSLNTVWEVQPEKGEGFLNSIKTRIINRAWSFLLVIGLAILLIAALVASTAFNVILGNFSDLIPGYSYVLYGVNILVSLALLTLALAAIYKVLPNAEIAWKDVWVGAAFTGLLFVIGKEALSLYLGRASVGSVYGAAGSLVVVLVWIYYTMQILLFGAEFTQVYARHYGSRVRPAGAKEPVTEARQAQAAQSGTVAREQQPRDALPREEEEVETVRRRPGVVWGLAERYASLVVGAAFGWLLAMTGFPRGRR